MKKLKDIKLGDIDWSIMLGFFAFVLALLDKTMILFLIVIFLLIYIRIKNRRKKRND